MISSEVQRTLVKSPPELWAEISDPESLARHLGEFGEIRITRMQPEQKIEWEAGDASGSIVIKPSGWGTKVRLTVQRELSAPETGVDADDTAGPVETSAAIELYALAPDEPAAPGAAAETPPEPTAEAAPDPTAEATFEPTAEATAEPEPEDSPVAEATGQPSAPPATEDAADAPRRLGFFARLFGRRRAARAAAEVAVVDAPAESVPAEFASPAEDDEAEEVHGASPDTPGEDGFDQPTTFGEAVERGEEAGAEEQTEEEPPAGAEEAAMTPAAEIERAEEAAEEQVTAVLTGVLDRLGAAHHRPFSRA